MTKQISAPTIRANVLAGIVLELRNQGTAVDRLFAKTRGLCGGFSDPMSRFPWRDSSVSWKTRRVRWGPLLGAKLGARSRMEDLGPIGLMFLASANLQIALCQLRISFPSCRARLGWNSMPAARCRSISTRFWDGALASAPGRGVDAVCDMFRDSLASGRLLEPCGSSLRAPRPPQDCGESKLTYWRFSARRSF